MDKDINFEYSFDKIMPDEGCMHIHEISKDEEDVIRPEHREKKLHPLFYQKPPEEVIIKKSLYPNLKEFENNTTSYDSYIKETKVVQLLTSQLNDSMKNEFLTLLNSLDLKLKHYKKIKNRWTQADSSIKIICISITGLISIGTVVVSGLGIIPAAGGTVGIILTCTFGGFNALYLFLTEGVSIGLTSRKKKIYREICESIALGSNKLYLFKQKALTDGVINNEEIEKAKKIVEEIKDEILKIKVKNKNIKKK